MKKCGRFVFVCMCVCATPATKLPKYYTQYLYTQYISILFPAQNGNVENGKAFVTPRHDKQTITGFLFNNFQQQNSHSQVRTGSRPVLDELYFWERGMIQMGSQYICLYAAWDLFMICPLMVFVFVDHDYYDVCCIILRGVCDMLLCFPLGISAICELVWMFG